MGMEKLSRLISFLTMFSISVMMISCAEKDEPEQEQVDEYAVPQLIYSAPTNTSFHRIAYFPYYRDCSAVSIPDETLGYIDFAYYAFASINSDFTITLESPITLSTLVYRCHKKGVKVVLSFNGTSSVFKEMVKKKSTRTKFIDSVMEIVSDYGLDGVDNDWEYPTAADQSALGNLYLMREFSNILHAPGVNKVLSMAITSGKYKGNYTSGIVSGVFNCVDWFNIMSYDDFSTSTPGINHSTLSLLKTGFDYWVTTREVPVTKFIGGIPCYGRPSGISQSGNTKTYSAIIAAGGDPDADEATVSSSNVSDYTIYYNGRKTVREKVNFCKEKKTGGYFFWEAGQDTHDDTSLMKAAFEESNK